MGITAISVTNVSGGVLNIADLTGGGSLAVSGVLTTDNGGTTNASRPITLQAFLNGAWVNVGSGTLPGSQPANTSGIGWTATITNTAAFNNIDGASVQFRAVVASGNNPGFSNIQGTASNYVVDSVADSGVSVNITDAIPGATPQVQYTISGLDAGSNATVTFTGSGGGSVQATVGADGSYSFNVAGLVGDITATVSVTDANGNTSTGTGDTQTGDPVCFYAGTLIATPTGSTAVDSLAAGDLVLTADGRSVPVRWIGRQTISTRFADPVKALPIRIRAGALAENLPARDLLVSPAHALLVDGVLVQAGALVNGTTITRETAVPEVFTWWHVETADHSLILAEGTPAETFVDNVDRENFDNWAEYAALVGDAVPVAEMDLPRAKSHRQVPAAIRAKIAARAEALLGATAAAA